MESLKRDVVEYVQLKEDLKKLTDRKKVLEKNICMKMEQNDINTLDLGNGSTINYLVKEALTVTKEKARKTKDDE